MFARSAREVALYEVVRFDFVLTLSDAPAGAPSAPAPPPILSAKGGQAFSSISRGFLKIEWAAGRKRLEFGIFSYGELFLAGWMRATYVSRILCLWKAQRTRQESICMKSSKSAGS